MKTTYLKPTMMVVTLQQQGIICTSPLSDVSTNLSDGDAIGYGGGGSGPARVRQHNAMDWEDWEQ